MAKPSKAPTARDVAEQAGVSPATVSYVLSGRRGGKDRISEETRQRVLNAVAELGYVPNQAARSLRRRRTERICLVLPHLGAPFYDLLVESVQSVAEFHGYSTVIAVGGSVERERRILGQLQRRLADGAIIEPRYVNGQDLAPLVQMGVAVVVLSDSIAGEGLDVVRTTQPDGIRAAVNHLVDRGHRRIAFLGNFSSHPTRYARYEAYTRAFEERGVSLDEGLVRTGSRTREEAYRATQALLALDDPPTAILAAADIAAISAIWAVRDAGLRVPDDVAVVGVGGIPEGEITRPPLTTVGPVSMDFSDVAQLLFDRLEGDVLPEGREHVRQWRLILRGSA